MEIIHVASLVGHHNPIYAIATGPEKYFYTGGNDRGVAQWDLQRPGFIKVLAPVHNTIYTLYRIPDTDLLFVGMRDGSADLLHRQSGTLQNQLVHHKQAVFAATSVRKESGKRELIVVSEDGTASVWNLDQIIQGDSQSLLYSFRVSEEPLRCVSVSPQQDYIAFGSKDGMVRVFKTDGYELQYELQSHTLPVTSLTFSPDGKRLLTGGRDAKLNVYNTLDFTLERDFVPHMFAVYGIHYHPELSLIATASRDKSIKLWSAEDFRLLKTISIEKGYNAHKLSINDITWDPTGNKLISVGDDKTVMIWELSL